MKFREFVKRTEKYIEVIRDIGKDEMYQFSHNLEITQDRSSNSLRLGGYNRYNSTISISYYAIIRWSKIEFQKFSSFEKKYAAIIENAYGNITYKGMNETEFIKNYLIEVLIHELLHENQYFPKWASINTIKLVAINKRTKGKVKKRMKYIEVPNMYKTTCFIIDHKEELYRRLGFLPVAQHFIFDGGFRRYSKLMKMYKRKNLTEEQLKTKIRNQLKNFFKRRYGKFVPYKRISIVSYNSIRTIYDLRMREFKNLNIDEIKITYDNMYEEEKDKFIEEHKRLKLAWKDYIIMPIVK